MRRRYFVESVIFLLLVALFGASCSKKRKGIPGIPAVKTAEVAPSPESARLIASWCQAVARETASLKWKLDPCQGMSWKIGGSSVQGRPLVYAEFGNPQATNTSLIISAVHGDEVTPVYIGLKLARWLQENQEKFNDVRVILAPLVNPDGFFAHPRTRVNSRGVDVNRNFATRDWSKRALSSWKQRFHSDPRRNPGKTPRSEPETLFQEELVIRSKAQKVLAIHSPLNFLDYDGPTAVALSRFSKEYVQECLKLRLKLKAVSGGFYPGSLGNFAGQELGIPTLTLELPSADPDKAEKYWQLFSQGIRTMIEFVVPLARTDGQPQVQRT